MAPKTTFQSGDVLHLGNFRATVPGMVCGCNSFEGTAVMKSFPGLFLLERYGQLRGFLIFLHNPIRISQAWIHCRNSRAEISMGRLLWKEAFQRPCQLSSLHQNKMPTLGLAFEYISRGIRHLTEDLRLDGRQEQTYHG